MSLVGPTPAAKRRPIIAMTVCRHNPMVIYVAVGRRAARSLIGAYVGSTSGGRRRTEVRWVADATVPSAAVAVALFQPRGEPLVGRGPAGHLGCLKVHIPLSTVDDTHLGRSDDPDQPGRKSTGQHPLARTTPKQPSTNRAARSHRMGKLD
jgi:hypothetical protein